MRVSLQSERQYRGKNEGDERPREAADQIQESLRAMVGPTGGPVGTGHTPTGSTVTPVAGNSAIQGSGPNGTGKAGGAAASLLMLPNRREYWQKNPNFSDGILLAC